MHPVTSGDAVRFNDDVGSLNIGGVGWIVEVAVRDISYASLGMAWRSYHWGPCIVFVTAAAMG